MDADGLVAVLSILANMCCNGENDDQELTKEQQREPGRQTFFRQVGDSVSATRLLSIEVVVNV